MDAQLNETEVVILDHRVELKNAHARLEKAKNKDEILEKKSGCSLRRSIQLNVFFHVFFYLKFISIVLIIG